jgi:hypothetical protein
MAATIFEEIRTNSESILNDIKRILNEGNVRKITFRNKDGKILLEAPLTVCTVGLGGMFLLHPIISAIGAFAMFANDIRIVVERTKENGDEKEVDAEVISIEDDENA